MMECVAPSLMGMEGVQLPVDVEIGLEMDGVTALLNLNTSVTVHQSPGIDEFEAMEFRQNEAIMLTITVSKFSLTHFHVAVQNPPRKGQPLVEDTLQSTIPNTVLARY